MLALDERARKFVLLRVHARKNPTQAARLAGYSTKTDGYLRVQGHRLMRQKAVAAALTEEAEKKFATAKAMALVGLADLVESKDAKTRSIAIDSVLDRSGVGRRTVQDIRVEHTDSRSTAELLELANRFQKMLPKPIEGEFTEVKDEN